MTNKRSKPDEAAAAEDAPFPRGGASVLTPLEQRKLRVQAQADFDREAAAGKHEKKSAKRSKKGDAGDADEDALFKAQSSAGHVPKFAELLRFSNLSVGAKLWGSVQEVTHKRLIIQLPHGLRGFVAPLDASDVLRSLLTDAPSKADKRLRGVLHGAVPTLPDLFYPGQFVRAAVSRLDDGQDDGNAPAASKGGKGRARKGKPGKKVHLSLCLADVCAGMDAAHFPLGAVVPAVVRTVEDTGCTCDVGVAAVSAFLPLEAYAAAFGAGAQPAAGQIVQGVVKQRLRDGARVVLGCDAGEVAAGGTKEFQGVTAGSLLPGQLVAVTVRNVLSDGLLVTFCKYFHGTIDLFHVPHDLAATWRAALPPGTRTPARILHVDPATKAVRLTLLKNLLAFHLPAALPALGDVHAAARVLRPDKSLGLLLALPTNPPIPAYVHISNVADRDVPDALGKSFPAGTEVTAKVTGFRVMDAIATASMRESDSAASDVTWASLAAGAVLEGAVHAVEEFGVLVQLGKSVRGLVPLAHVSEAAAPKKLSARFKPGQTVRVRVMDVDPEKRAATLTLKKGLIESKLAPVLSLDAVAPGARAHGWVSGITDKGIFVGFYNRIKGLVPPGEVPLADGAALRDAYAVGQVLKCTVVGVDARKGLRLSLARRTAAAAASSALDAFSEGAVLSDATIVRVEPSAADGEVAAAVYVTVATGDATATACIAAEHLSDHPHAASALAATLQPGMTLPRVVLLEKRPTASLLIASCKHSLVEAAAAGDLPCDIASLRPGARAPGFIASVTADACFVRFGGGLTGRAGLPQLADAFVSDPSAHFRAGQSVRAAVLDVQRDAGRFTVSLKPSVACEPSGALLQGMFRDLALAARLSDVASSGPAIGSVINVVAKEQQPYGLVCDLPEDDVFVGLVATAQAPPASVTTTPGSALRARVLDVQPLDGILDLTAKEVLLHEAPPATLRPGDAVTAKIELIKRDGQYLVVTLPAHGDAVAFVSLREFNFAHGGPQQRFSTGQRVSAVVSDTERVRSGGEAGPSGRTVLHLPLPPPLATTVSGSGKAATALGKNKGAEALVGTVVKARVHAIHAAHATVHVGTREGKLHACDVLDLDAETFSEEDSMPLATLTVGQELDVAVLGVHVSKAPVHHTLNVSAKPSALDAARAGAAPSPIRLDELRENQRFVGSVQTVARDHLWVLLTAGLRGRVRQLHAAEDPERLAALSNTFKPGQAVRVSVAAVDVPLERVDLTMLGERFAPCAQSSAPPKVGQLVMGEIKSCAGAGVTVHVASGLGFCAITSLHDAYVPNALEGLKPGQFVRGSIAAAERDDKGRWLLSLRQGDGGAHAGHRQVADGPATPAATAKVRLAKGDIAHGYVRSAQGEGRGAGVFVALSATQAARVKLRMLADEFVSDPVATFPVGRHVRGRVIEVSGDRVELSLKSAQAEGTSGWQSLSSLQVGQVVTGTVKKVESFGVFVALAASLLTGLCHVSELSDDFVKDPAARHQPGQAVRAVVLKKDAAKGQLSLGMKASYFVEGDEEEPADEAAVPEAGGGAPVDTGDGDDESVDLEDAMLAAYAESSDDSDGNSEEGGDGSVAEGSSGEEGLDTSDNGGAAALTVAASTSDDDGDPAPAKRQRAEVDASALDARRASGAAASAPPASGIADLGWGGLTLDDDAPADAPSPDAAAVRPPSKRARKRAREERDAAVRAAEQAKLEGAAPQSVDDFERLVLASPSSSYVWIRYMAFLLKAAEVDRARAVAERAFSTIDYREDKEKFNVWVALLNLDCAYADDPEAAAAATLARALQHNDAKKMHLAAIDIFERAKQPELLAAVAKGARRKFGASCKVWLRLHRLDVAGGRDGGGVLERAVKSLPARKHVKLLSRAALAEFREGSPERARAIFENLLQTYPKRTDLWGMYLDQEIRAGNAVATRNAFERAIHLNLAPKRMRYFFKRYVEFESEHGTPERVEYVKQRALEFVQGRAQA